MQIFQVIKKSDNLPISCEPIDSNNNLTKYSTLNDNESILKSSLSVKANNLNNGARKIGDDTFFKGVIDLQNYIIDS